MIRPVVSGALTETFTARLSLVSGPKRMNEIILIGGTRSIFFGKQTDQTLVLLGSLVSRIHGRFEITSRGWRIVDNNSTNGLFVNGERISDTDLRSGDKVRIGEYEFLYTQLKNPDKGPSGPPRHQSGIRDDDLIPLVTDDEDQLSKGTQIPLHDGRGGGGGGTPPVIAVVPGDVPLRVSPVLGGGLQAPSPVALGTPSIAPIRVAPVTLHEPAAPPTNSAIRQPASLPIRVAPVESADAARPAPQVAVPIPAPMVIAAPIIIPTRSPPPPRRVLPVISIEDGPTCPSCNRMLEPSGSICVNCGIYIDTGKSIVISRGFDEEAFEDRLDMWVRAVSLPISVMVLPVGSEAFGTRRALAITAITILTCLLSVGFLIGSRVSDPMPPRMADLLLWPPGESFPDMGPLPPPGTVNEQGLKFDDGRPVPPGIMFDELVQLDALKKKDVDAGKVPEHLRRPLILLVTHDMPRGEWRPYQLLTHAFVHDYSSVLGLIAHFGGNLLFMLIFGLRVNELIGSTRTFIIYPLLAIGSGAAHILMSQPNALGIPIPMMGASGAIMGLAGMYLVLFPVQKVRMVAWIRFLIFTPCYYSTFAVRGFWMLAIWMVYHDVLPVLIGSKDRVAHWAHLGGFLTGVGVAMLLLVSRNINAMGADIFSVMLGRRAWWLVGKPRPVGAAGTPAVTFVP